MTKPILFFLVLATFAHADKREEAWRAEDERQWTAAVANARCRPLLESGLALSLETVNAAVKVGETLDVCTRPFESTCRSGYSVERPSPGVHSPYEACMARAKTQCKDRQDYRAALGLWSAKATELQRKKEDYERCSGRPLPSPRCPARYRDVTARCVAPEGG